MVGYGTGYNAPRWAGTRRGLPREASFEIYVDPPEPVITAQATTSNITSQTTESETPAPRVSEQEIPKETSLITDTLVKETQPPSTTREPPQLAFPQPRNAPLIDDKTRDEIILQSSNSQLLKYMHRCPKARPLIDRDVFDPDLVMLSRTKAARRSTDWTGGPPLMFAKIAGVVLVPRVWRVVQDSSLFGSEKVWVVERNDDLGLVGDAGGVCEERGAVDGYGVGFDGEERFWFEEEDWVARMESGEVGEVEWEGWGKMGDVDDASWKEELYWGNLGIEEEGFGMI